MPRWLSSKRRCAAAWTCMHGLCLVCCCPISCCCSTILRYLGSLCNHGACICHLALQPQWLARSSGCWAAAVSYAEALSRGAH